MRLELTGKVTNRLEAESGEGKNGRWSKTTFVIEYGDEYPKKAAFLAWTKLENIVKGLKEGDEIKVSFRTESREYNERWYTDNVAYKIEVNGAAPPAAKETAPPPPPPPAAEPNDLPF